VEEIIILLIVLLLIFGSGSVRLPGETEFPEEPEVKGSITGNQAVEIVEKGDIHLEFQGQIGGNARVDVESEEGNVYLRFAEKIAGNPRVKIVARRGSVFVRFEEGIAGNARVNIESTYGDVTFANERSRIENLLEGNNLRVQAGGEIRYRTASLRDLITAPGLPMKELRVEGRAYQFCALSPVVDGEAAF